MQLNDSPPTGLEFSQCLKILHEQIAEILDDFKRKKSNFKLLSQSFFRQNYIELIHNSFAIFLCSISLFISFNERE